MASYRFPKTAPTATAERDVRLSAEERDFLGFLLYQHGYDWTEDASEEWGEWMEALSSKME